MSEVDCVFGLIHKQIAEIERLQEENWRLREVVRLGHALVTEVSGPLEEYRTYRAYVSAYDTVRDLVEGEDDE